MTAEEQAKDREQTPNKKEESHAPISSINETINSSATNPNTESNTKEDSKNRIQIFFDGAMVIFTLILACATIVLAIYTYSLFRETVHMGEITQRGILKSDSTTRRSLQIADSSLKLTKVSLDITQNNFHIENRPYVYIKDLMFDKPEIEKHIKITGVIINGGKTQAINVAYKSGFCLHTVPNYNGNFIEDAERIFIPDLPPNDRYPIFEEPGYRIKNGFFDVIPPAYIYFYGTITYNDVFGNNYYTNFCAFCCPKTGVSTQLNNSFNNIK